MSIIKRSNKKTQKRTIILELPDGESVVVTRSTVDGTLFPEKLAKANAMLKNAKLMDRK
ncbi:hypothetical protein [uncultured Chitinophaga sp.]|uniref:hypothetical protein n=1 Tax=uncultured Chitinophaga sp. TaxID=339340 RepID=UPI002609415A|nr:hypothetical protein [uncultured Chitinophaga sp.]